MSSKATALGHDCQCQTSCHEYEQKLGAVDGRLDLLQLVLWDAHDGGVVGNERGV